MKLKSQIKIGCVWTLFLTCLTWPVAWADTPAFRNGGYSPGQAFSFTGTKGWGFAEGGDFRTNTPILITQLGVFDQGGDGLANSHAVGLWTANGILLASNTVPAGTAAPLVDGYRYVSITPVYYYWNSFTDSGDKYYVVGAEYSAGDADDLVTPQAAGYSDVVHAWGRNGIFQGYYGVGTGLPFPGGTIVPPIQENGSPPFWEVNLQYVFVPEPSILLLLVPGLLYLLLRHRKLR